MEEAGEGREREAYGKEKERKEGVKE
jgi:hypothetical protein